MSFIKKYFVIMLIVFLSLGTSADAITEFSELKEFPEIANIDDLAAETKNRQDYISKYIKNHNKNQNLEIFLLWEQTINDNLIKNNFYSDYFILNYYNPEYLKKIKNQFAKTGLYAAYDKKYRLKINYKEEYKLFAKYLPEDWELYLQILCSEQTLNADLNEIASILVKWENFINKYPDFEKIWLVYEKMHRYEQILFPKTVFTKETIKFYDGYSKKYPYSKYSRTCTRFSNLTQNKHNFISPYNNVYSGSVDKYNNYLKTLDKKTYILNNTGYVFNSDNNVWLGFTAEYIRGNYVFLLFNEEKVVKCYDGKYSLISTLTRDEGFKLENIFIKDGRLFYYDDKKLKINEFKYKDKTLSLCEIDKAALSELFQDKKIIYISSLTKKEDTYFQITVKNKKYPNGYVIFNDTEKDFSDYIFVQNSDIERLSNKNIFTIKQKTCLELVLDQKNTIIDDNADDGNTGNDDANKNLIQKYIFIFE